MTGEIVVQLEVYIKVIVFILDKGKVLKMDQVQQAIPSLIAAVELTLNPSTSQNQRRLAYETCKYTWSGSKQK